MLSDQREQGRKLVLDAIRKSGRVARIDLARATGISQATVTSITGELLREGLIEEVPREDTEQEARRGRPRIDLKPRGVAHIVAGMKIAHLSISVVFLDYEGQELGAFETDIEKESYDEGDFAALVSNTLTEAANSCDVDAARVSALGLGLSGIVDVERGIVYWSPSLSSRNVRLEQALVDELSVPVFIDNDANLVAVAERAFGVGKDASNFVVLTIENGVGMGIILDGELYRGSRGCGAEFGHTKVQLDGALCRCGQRGCLEAYVADYALLREATVSGLVSENDPPDVRLRKLINAAASGHGTARSIVDRASRMFAMGLANVVNMFDPDLIIISGERMRFDFLYADSVLESIRDSIVQIDAEPPKILIHKWGDQMWAKGAAAHAIDGVTDLALKRLSANAE
jgi:predicted NBD/HSP70 family sugar kinase